MWRTDSWLVVPAAICVARYIIIIIIIICNNILFNLDNNTIFLYAGPLFKNGNSSDSHPLILDYIITSFTNDGHQTHPHIDSHQVVISIYLTI